MKKKKDEKYLTTGKKKGKSWKIDWLGSIHFLVVWLYYYIITRKFQSDRRREREKLTLKL